MPNLRSLQKAIGGAASNMRGAGTGERKLIPASESNFQPPLTGLVNKIRKPKANKTVDSPMPNQEQEDSTYNA